MWHIYDICGVGVGPSILNVWNTMKDNPDVILSIYKTHLMEYVTNYIFGHVFCNLEYILKVTLTMLSTKPWYRHDTNNTLNRGSSNYSWPHLCEIIGCHRNYYPRNTIKNLDLVMLFQTHTIGPVCVCVCMYDSFLNIFYNLSHSSSTFTC